jgi:hypothetical protein
MTRRNDLAALEAVRLLHEGRLRTRRNPKIWNETIRLLFGGAVFQISCSLECCSTFAFFGIQYNLPSSGIQQPSFRGQLSYRPIGNSTVYPCVPLCVCVGANTWLTRRTWSAVVGRDDVLVFKSLSHLYVNALGTRHRCLRCLQFKSEPGNTTLALLLTYFHTWIYIVFAFSQVSYTSKSLQK